jgi:hypothetical protein
LQANATASTMKNLICVLLLSLLSEPLLAQCSLISRWGERGATRDLIVEGSTVIAADGRGIAVYDTSNPAILRQTGTARTGAVALAIEPTTGGYAVLTAKGLELFTIENGAPRSTWAGEEHRGEFLSCDGALCATAGATVEIFRVGGGAIEHLASGILAQPADSVLVREGRIYVGSGRLTTSVFDATGSRVAELPVAALDLASSGPWIFAASGGSGLTVIEHGATPQITGRHFIAESDLRRLHVSGSDLFAFDALTGEIVRIDVAGAPRIVARAPEVPQVLRASGGQLFTATPGRGLRVRNGSDLALISDFEQAEGPLTGAATDGSFAYVADPPLFRVIDLRDPLRPREVASLPLDDSADRVRIRGGMAIVYGRANVHLIDISQPAHPRYLGVYRSLGTIPNGAAFAGDLLIEDNKASGFHVLDISDPSNPIQIGGLKNDFYGQYYGVAARPGAAYGFTQRVLKVIDLSDPRNPAVVRVIETLSIIDAEIVPATSGHPELLLLADAGRLRIFDITAPLQPVELPALEIAGIVDVAAGMNVAWVSTSAGEIHRVELANGPAHISHSASGFLGATQISVAPDDSHIAVADSYSLVVMGDLARAAQQPAAPAISLSGRRNGAAQLTWSGTAGMLYELQTSADAAFTSPQTTLLSGASAEIPGTGALFVRVRATTGCTTSGWSNTLAIDAPAGSLTFATAGQRLLTGAPGAVEISVTVVNRGGSSASPAFEVSTEPAGISVVPPQTQSIGAGDSGTFRFAMTLPPGVATGIVRLRIAGTDAEHTVSIARLSPVQTARAAGDALVLAGVAATPGTNETIWKTDLNLLCRGALACPLQLTFNRFATLEPAQSVQFELAAGEGVVVRDAVTSLFGASPAFGAFEIRSPRLESILASAVTYNQAPSGRFGQRIASARVDARAGGGRRESRLHGIAQNEEFRTNIGLVNLSGVQQQATLRLGSATATVDLRPWEGIQHGVTTFFPSGCCAGEAAVLVDAPPQVVSYQSRVDQRTGDGTYSLAQRVGQEPRGTRFVRNLTVAVRSPGALGTSWRTALQLANDGAQAQVVELTFVPAVDPSLARTKSATIEQGGLFAHDDVMAWMGVPEDQTFGWLRVESDRPFTGWGRIYNDAASGTFGQYVPLEESSPAAAVMLKSALAPSRTARQIFPVSHTAERRTNFGVAEVSGKAATLRMKFADPSGAFLGVHERRIEAFGSQVLFDLLAPWSGVEGLRVEVEVEGEGDLRVYASTVENSNGDAVYIPAE